MPSSTSNSRPQLPHGPWGKIWFVSIVVVVVVLAGWEGFWRLSGFAPSLENDIEAWVVARQRVQPDSVVLVGTSRMQTGLQPEAFATEVDGRVPIQLAMLDASPLPVLEQLANDQSFSGLVIVDLLFRFVFDATREGEEIALMWLQAYQLSLSSPSRWSEARLRLLVQPLFAFRHPALSPRRLISAAKNREMPKMPFYSMRSDRFLPMDFAKHSAQEKKERENGISQRISIHARPASERELEAILERLEWAAARIRKRGGQVVFVQFPTSG